LLKIPDELKIEALILAPEMTNIGLVWNFSFIKEDDVLKMSQCVIFILL
jgi:hypothetical protein